MPVGGSISKKSPTRRSLFYAIVILLRILPVTITLSEFLDHDKQRKQWPIKSHRIFPDTGPYTGCRSILWSLPGSFSALFLCCYQGGILVRRGYHVQYFLSPEQLGIKFRTLILLAPLILTIVSYLIYDRANLFLKSIAAEQQLRLLRDDLIIAFANALDAKSS